MKNLKKFKFNIYFKIIALEILVILIMSILAPYLLNYPPNSEDKVFQGQIEPITHFQQYLSLGSLAIIIYIFFIKHLFKDIFAYLKKDRKKVTPLEIEKVRNQCFVIPQKLIFVQIIILVVVLLILFVSMNANIRLCFKFLLVYFSFFTVIAIISGILLKDDLNKVIKSTYIAHNIFTPTKKKTHFDKNLLYNLLPFFVVTIIAVSLLGYAKVCDAIGESHYHYYKLYLDDINTQFLSIPELKAKLDTVPLMNTNNYYFIHINNEQYYSKPNGNVSDFFIKYADTYLSQNNGRIYEYYGIEEEGFVKKVTLENGQTGYIGFKYTTTNNELIVFFMGIAIISIIIYMLILMIWAKNISKNIVEVSTKLTEISSQTSGIDKVELLPIISTDEIGDLTIAFNKIQVLTKQNIDQIHDNQNMLMERERLASLGQLIGGIAHNLKTPIMSISGAAEGLDDLIKEYEVSVGDPDVTTEDHHAIASDMKEWIEKVRSYTEYMSDVITAVKGQAVTMAAEQAVSFTLDELVKRVNILMKHELKNALVTLNVHMIADPNIALKGNINSLVQVINNMISNAIQAYNGKTNEVIELILNLEDNKVIISIKDYAGGLPKEVQQKLFKEMITTKGKNGTGLGLFMSYSTIRAHFSGNITYETEKDQGTVFHISLPITLA